MKSYKKVLLAVTILFTSFLLFACGETKEIVFEFKGIENVTIEYEAAFNVLTNVKVVDSNKVEYTDITFKTTSKSVATDGKLDSKVPGEVKVQYEFTKGELKLQEWRTITVKEPEREGDDLLQNGDFSMGTTYWTGDQGKIELTVNEGVLEIVMVAGGNTHEPRLHQMGIPFENETTYEVKFEAKALDEKKINLQVGEMLSNDPWFTDFKQKQTEHRVITTEWATYSFKFTHKLDNDRGGLIFEFGKIGSEQVDTTLFLKNIEINEAVADKDIVAPEFNGLKDKTILVNDEFDPLNGVTAYDVVDGDVTEGINVVIKDSAEAVVTEINTKVAGEYTITYTVEDNAGNMVEETITLTIKEIAFSEDNLLTNGDFSNLEDDSWNLHLEDGNTATNEILDGKMVVTTTDIVGPGYGIQLFQENVILKEGSTYLISFKASSTVNRDFNVNVGVGLDQDPWFISYMDSVLFSLTNELKEYTVLFAVGENNTTNAKFVLEFGNINEAVASVITIDDVKIVESLEPHLIDKDFTNVDHNVFINQDGGLGTETRTKDNLVIDVTQIGEHAHTPHYFYEFDGLKAGTYKFKLSIAANVARTLRFNIILPESGYSSILEDGFIDFDSIKDDTYELVVEFTIEEDLNQLVKLELDFGLIDESNEIGIYTLSNILFYLK